MKYGKYAGLPHNRGAITLERKKKKGRKNKEKETGLELL